MNYELGREFCRRVTAQLRHVTGGEKAAIEEELMGHIEDRVEALTALKWPEDEAEQRAVAAMGNPEEVGRRLAKEYPLSWLVVGRIAAAMLVLLIFPMLLGTIVLYDAVGDFFDRFRLEEEFSAAEMLDCDEWWEPDIQQEIGSGDVLRIVRVGIRQGADGWKYVRLQIYGHDRCPFGKMEIALAGHIRVVSAAGEIYPGGGAFSGIDYMRWSTEEIPVEADAEELVLIYEAYGRYAEVCVPLVKEGSA